VEILRRFGRIPQQRGLVTARRPEHRDDLVRKYDGLVRTVALDVTDAAASGAAVQAAVDDFGRLDIVVNNAGYAISAPIEEMNVALGQCS
jgi:NADP-dependent 3-hydroxy acid dehydrogenase YdfG